MSESTAEVTPKPANDKSGRRPGIFARLATFIRQIIAELKKVVTPSRNEMRTFFIVVTIFVIAMMAFTGVLDFLFAQLVKFMFGG